MASVSGKLFFALAIMAVASAVVAGLLMVGGPLQGQRDKFDDQRYEELGGLARALLCEEYGQIPNSSLPNELTVESLRVHCSSAGIAADDLSDNETGQPYVYDRKNARDFSICAKFHDAKRAARLNSHVSYGASFNPETGCVSGWLR
jgi:hypothetical protein